MNDGAILYNLETSKRKTQTASSIRSPTGTFSDNLALAFFF
ncbi:hypothetical protein [Nostoc sp.]